jgi:3-hydroxyisobutyrate dehydrogenase
MKTGFVGLGAMGRGMAENLRHAGHLACAWNRTRGSVEAYATERGIRLADGPEALARECDLVVTCVSADTDLREVAEDLAPGLRPGTVVVDCSTVSADTARALDEKLRAVGASFLDAPVSGGVEGARNGTLAMMVGGDARVLERVRPVLEAMAARIVHMGPAGAGQATKAVNQIMGAGINQAVSEALAFGAAHGLDLAKVIEVVSQGAAGNWFLQHRGPTMIQGQFPAGFKVALHLKDLRICRAMAEDKGVALSVVDQTLGDYQRLVDGGHGDEDISALYRLKSALFGTDG